MWLSHSSHTWLALLFVSCSHHLTSMCSNMAAHLPYYLIILLSPLKYDFLCAPSLLTLISDVTSIAPSLLFLFDQHHQHQSTCYDIYFILHCSPFYFWNLCSVLLHLDLVHCVIPPLWLPDVLYLLTCVFLPLRLADVLPLLTCVFPCD